MLYRLGIEGLVMFKRDIQFDADNYTITAPLSPTTGSPYITISVFDKVVVDIEVEKDKNTQRGRVKMMLVSPVDSRAL
jgi:exosome complex exonuclease DIS3/RRP44